jgi:murein DD-endopeptidase MepM/ murein hydrolase activator NlpD
VWNVIRERSRNNTFGKVRTDKHGAPKFHQGWDLEAAVNTPCYAVAEGKVVLIETQDKFNPDLSTIDHAFGKYVLMSFTNCDYLGDYLGLPKVLYAFYGHLNDLFVKVGDRVTPQTVIGKSGKTGNARYSWIPPHLHFGIQDKFGVGGNRDPELIYGDPPLLSPVCRYTVWLDSM